MCFGSLYYEYALAICWLRTSLLRLLHLHILSKVQNISLLELLVVLDINRTFICKGLWPINLVCTVLSPIRSDYWLSHMDLISLMYFYVVHEFNCTYVLFY